MDLADGSLAAGALVVTGWAGCRAWSLFGRELWQGTRTAVEGRLVVKRERACGDRIVAVVAASPVGARLVDQDADGPRPTICWSNHAPARKDPHHDR